MEYDNYVYSVQVKDVSKKYKTYFDKKYSLKERLLSIFKKKSYQEFWVLKNINLELKKGTTVGLIGRNGSGKSTLLKLLSKIIYPTQGSIEVKGRVSSLLELGAGFHPDFSGLENIYNNAAIFGLSNKEIKSKLKQIIDFSELGEYLNNPVRTYSSGMYARLAFSVAINVDADVLLVDEILSVGDISFQEKCLDKINEIKQSNVTIVIVSHDLTTLEKMCDKVVWINEGEVFEEGHPRKVINSFKQFMNAGDIL